MMTVRKHCQVMDGSATSFLSLWWPYSATNTHTHIETDRSWSRGETKSVQVGHDQGKTGKPEEQLGKKGAMCTSTVNNQKQMDLFYFLLSISLIGCYVFKFDHPKITIILLTFIQGTQKYTYMLDHCAILLLVTKIDVLILLTIKYTIIENTNLLLKIYEWWPLFIYHTVLLKIMALYFEYI